jgi:hypothetical protein
VNVVLHGAHLDAEAGCDLSVGQAVVDQVEDLSFTRRQLGRAGTVAGLAGEGLDPTK